MPRRGFVPKREVLDDPMYGGKVVTKLINQVMLDGKRGTAQKACYGAFEIIREKTGREPIEVFEQAMNNIMPVVEVKARRVGGATYQVPIEIRPERRQTLGLRWLVNYSRSRGERTMMERLAGEIMDAANSTGSRVCACRVGQRRNGGDQHHQTEQPSQQFLHVVSLRKQDCEGYNLLCLFCTPSTGLNVKQKTKKRKKSAFSLNDMQKALSAWAGRAARPRKTVHNPVLFA